MAERHALAGMHGRTAAHPGQRAQRVSPFRQWHNPSIRRSPWRPHVRDRGTKNVHYRPQVCIILNV